MSQFLIGLFEEGDPLALTGRMFGSQKGSKLTAAEIVDRAAAKLKTSLTDKPRTRAALLDCIGNVYLAQGRSRDAEPLLREAVQLRRTLVGEDNIEMATSLQSVGMLLLSLGEIELGGQELERALALRRKHLGSSHPLVGDSLFYLGLQRMLIYEFSAAEPLLQECLAIRRRLTKGPSYEVAMALFLLSQVYFITEQHSKAFEALRETLETLDQVAGASDLTAVIRLFIKAQFDGEFRNVATARASFEKADAKASELLGRDHPLVITFRGLYADYLNAHDQFEAAAAVRRDLVASYRKVFGPDSLTLTGKLLTLAYAERRLNRTAEAETALRDAVRIHRKHNSQSPNFLEHLSACLHVLGERQTERGELPEAIQSYIESVAIRVRLGLLKDDRTYAIARGLTQRLLVQKRGSAGDTFGAHTKPTGQAKTDFELARTWARGAQVLTDLYPKPTDDDKLALEFLRRQAVGMLGHAVAAGMSDKVAIQECPEFKPLHDRADFHEVMRRRDPYKPE